MINAEKLCCPLCGQAFVELDKPLRCPEGHSFDVARQGYVNLLPVQHKKSKAPGDSKEMVDARQCFLDSGVYLPIAQMLLRTVDSLLPNGDVTLLDAGCGEGYYLNYLAAHLNNESASLIGVDISKPAIVAAARRNKAITWIVGSNKQLPVVPASLDVIICMFGYPMYEAFAKVLKPGGKVLFTYATRDFTGQEEFDGRLEFMGQALYYSHKCPEALIADLKQVGFSIDAAEYRDIGDEVFLWITAGKPQR